MPQQKKIMCGRLFSDTEITLPAFFLVNTPLKKAYSDITAVFAFVGRLFDAGHNLGSPVTRDTCYLLHCSFFLSL